LPPVAGRASADSRYRPPGSNLTARAEAHVIRLALLYALLDGQNTIQPEHLHPALALWD
jgi:hypothetical protein